LTQNEKPRLLFGYAISGKPLFVSIIAIFTAMTTITTMIFKIPINPVTGQYFNFGDTSVMIVGLLFGPWAGLFAGGFGSMLGDVIAEFTGSPGALIFAPFTFIAKGLEGLLVGFIANPRNREKKPRKFDIIGGLFGGLPVIIVYYIVEVFLISPEWALIEMPWNFAQIGSAITISYIVLRALWQYLNDDYPQIRNTFYPSLDSTVSDKKSNQKDL
jgi:uncharacterized membrane protein